MKKEYEIEHYQTANGKVPFQTWTQKLKDRLAWSKIMIRLDRLQLGNFGDCKPVGSGVSELKIDYGPGYRVYFGKAGKKVVVLLMGGTKRTQDSDILKAKRYWDDYKKR